MNKMKRTHKGLMFGCVPVFLDMTDEYCPSVEGRNFLCEIFLSVAHHIFAICIFLRSAVDPHYEPSFPIQITGEL